MLIQNQSNMSKGFCQNQDNAPNLVFSVDPLGERGFTHGEASSGICGSVTTTQTSWNLWFWMSYLSEIFWRHCWDVCTLVLNILKFLVYLSVYSLPYFLPKIRLSLDISSSRCAIFLIFSGDIPGMFVHYFWIIWDFFYVCKSVHWLMSLLKLG